jgi:membrane protein
MRIPSSITREYIGTIFFFIFQVQIISVLIDENWNPILQILPIRKSDYFVAYVKVLLIYFFLYLVCTIWFDTMITKLFLLFVVAPVGCLYYCLHNFKNMTVVKSNNMYIRYVGFVIFTVLFTWIRNQLILCDSVIVYGNLVFFGIFVLLMLACMHEIRKGESI